MKTSPIDVVIGPIESYQDALYGTKAAYEAFMLLKDKAWSERLSRFAQHLPPLQRGLPVDAKYKPEMPGTDAGLNAYDALYYGGGANAGAKTIAIDLPNDEELQLARGSRRLRLKNAMRAKFDTILEPIFDELIAADQRPHVTFDALFENVLFHEVAYGLGTKNTLDGKGTMRRALTDVSSGYEEGKADILGLYMIGKVGQMGELDADKRDDTYVTFLAGIVRSVRFGATPARPDQHGGLRPPAGTRRLRPRGRWPLSGGPGQQAGRGGCAVREVPDPAGRTRPFRRARVPQPVRQGRGAAAGRPGPHREEEHPGGHRAQAKARGAGGVIAASGRR